MTKSSFARFKSRVTKKIKETLLVYKDGQEVLRNFDESLQQSLIISSSFSDIAESNLNKRQRQLQLILILAFVVYVIPVHVVQCILYFFKDIKWKLFDTVFPDTFAHIPIVGQLINCVHVCFSMIATADKILIRNFEGKNSIQFLTDLSSLIQCRRYFRLNDEEVDSLLKKAKKKIIFFKINMTGTVLMACFIQTVGLVFLFLKNPPSLLFGIYSILYLVIANMFLKSFLLHFFKSYLSYVIMTDCLNARIASVVNRLKTNRSEMDMIDLLNEIESIFGSLKQYNKAIRVLLRNMVYLFRTGLCSLFVVCSMDMNTFERTIITYPFVATACIIIITGLYVSQTKTMLSLLYKKLNNSFVRSSRGSMLPFKLKIQARLLIKELGNDDKDGHFVLGFADGKGPETSPMEITNLVLDTTFNCMMILKILMK